MQHHAAPALVECVAAYETVWRVWSSEASRMLGRYGSTNLGSWEAAQCRQRDVLPPCLATMPRGDRHDHTVGAHHQFDVVCREVCD